MPREIRPEHFELEDDEDSCEEMYFRKQLMDLDMDKLML